MSGGLLTLLGYLEGNLGVSVGFRPLILGLYEVNIGTYY